eukprot:1697642-Pyramimonas_sp.AAC.1
MVCTTSPVEASGGGSHVICLLARKLPCCSCSRGADVVVPPRTCLVWLRSCARGLPVGADGPQGGRGSPGARSRRASADEGGARA